MIALRPLPTSLHTPMRLAAVAGRQMARGIGFIRPVAILTLVCFIYTSIGAPCVEGAIELSNHAQAQKQLKEKLSAGHLSFGMDLPISLGKITGGEDCGGNLLVVNIQDLHCHAEVQRNISRILGFLDKKYGLKKVYIEGGYGDIDVSWINTVTDQATKTTVIDSLLDNGRLTGSEYYAMTNGRSDLLRGLEDERLHKANIVRLGTMLDRRAEYERILRQLNRDLDVMKAKYLTVKNKRFNALLARYRAGKISTARYYQLLNKYIATINRHPERYHNILPLRADAFPAIQSFLAAASMQKHIDFGRVASQTKEFTLLLQAHLPRDVYNDILARTDNLADTDALYTILAGLITQYKLDTGTGFPDLTAFFAYMEKNQAINPGDLVNEEQRLVNELRGAFSQDIAEVEVSFLCDFVSCFEDYLLNRLSARDYAYFQSRFGKFQATWAKYTFRNHLQDLSADFPLLDAYYAANERRNTVFFENFFTRNPVTDTRQGSTAAREVIVVVSGGFHTEGIGHLLAERSISYCSITPRVTLAPVEANTIYETTTRGQAALFKAQALGDTVMAELQPHIAVNGKDISIDIGGIRFAVRDGKFTSTEPRPLVREVESKGLDYQGFRRLVILALGLSTPNPLKIIPGINKAIESLGNALAAVGITDAGLLFPIASSPAVQKALLDGGYDLAEVSTWPIALQAAVAATVGARVGLEAVRDNPETTPLLQAVLHVPGVIETIAGTYGRLRDAVNPGTADENISEQRAGDAEKHIPRHAGSTSLGMRGAGVFSALARLWRSVTSKISRHQPAVAEPPPAGDASAVEPPTPAGPVPGMKNADAGGKRGSDKNESDVPEMSKARKIGVGALSAAVSVGMITALLFSVELIYAGIAAGLFGALFAFFTRKVFLDRGGLAGNLIAVLPAVGGIGAVLFLQAPLWIAVLAVGWGIGALIPRAVAGRQTAWYKYYLARPAAEQEAGEPPITLPEHADKISRTEVDLQARAHIMADIVKTLDEDEREFFVTKYDWSLAQHLLSRANRDKFSVKKYGESLEKTSIGGIFKDAWDAAKNRARENNVGSLLVRTGVGFLGGFAVNLFNGFFLRYLGSTFQYYYAGKGRESFLSYEEVTQIIKDDITAQRRAVHPFDGFRQRVADASFTPLSVSESKIKKALAGPVHALKLPVVAIYVLFSSSFSGVKAGMGSTRWVRHAADGVKLVSEITFFTPLLRFLKDRGKLYVITSVVIGSVVTVVGMHPFLMVPLLVLYAWKVWKWGTALAPKNSASTPQQQRKRTMFLFVTLFAIPGMVVALTLFGAPVFTALASFAAAQTSPVLATFLGSVTLPGVFRPFATVFIRQLNDGYHRNVGQQLVRRLATQVEALPGAAEFSFEGPDTFLIIKNESGDELLRIKWGYTAVDIQRAMEQLRAYDPADNQQRPLESLMQFETLKKVIAEHLTAVMDYNDAIKASPGNALMSFFSLGFMTRDVAFVTGTAVQKARVRQLLKGLSSQGPPAASPEKVASIRAVVQSVAAQSPAEVLATARFWKGILNGWFTMWFVNTEIALVLGQMDLFDRWLAKIVSFFTGDHGTIHFFTQLGMIVEGANQHHRVASSGNVLFNSDSWLGRFVERGGALGAFNNLATDASTASGLVFQGESPVAAWQQVQDSVRDRMDAQRIAEAISRGELPTQEEADIQSLLDLAVSTLFQKAPVTAPGAAAGATEVPPYEQDDHVTDRLAEQRIAGTQQSDIYNLTDPNEIARVQQEAGALGIEIDVAGLEGVANTYDQALILDRLIASGDTTAAKDIITEMLGQYDYDIPPQSSVDNDSVRTGEALWYAMEVAKYVAVSGDRDPDLLGYLGRTIAYVDENMNYAGAVAMGPAQPGTIATEHNLDALAFLTAMSVVSPDREDIREMRDRVSGWLVEEAYLPTERRFIMGTNAGFATDTTAWGVQALLAVKEMDPDYYQEKFAGTIDLDALLMAADQARVNNFQYTKPDGTVVTLDNLYVFSTAGVSVPSVEFSAQMAAAYYLRAQDIMLTAGNDPAQVALAAQWQARGDAILADIAELDVDGDGALPASPVTGWALENAWAVLGGVEQTASTLWVEKARNARLGINPFLIVPDENRSVVLPPELADDGTPIADAMAGFTAANSSTRNILASMRERDETGNTAADVISELFGIDLTPTPLDQGIEDTITFSLINARHPYGIPRYDSQGRPVLEPVYATKSEVITFPLDPADYFYSTDAQGNQVLNTMGQQVVVAGETIVDYRQVYDTIGYDYYPEQWKGSGFTREQIAALYDNGVIEKGMTQDALAERFDLIRHVGEYVEELREVRYDPARQTTYTGADMLKELSGIDVGSDGAVDSDVLEVLFDRMFSKVVAPDGTEKMVFTDAYLHPDDAAAYLSHVYDYMNAINTTMVDDGSGGTMPLIDRMNRDLADLQGTDPETVEPRALQMGQLSQTNMAFVASQFASLLFDQYGNEVTIARQADGSPVRDGALLKTTAGALFQDAFGNDVSFVQDGSRWVSTDGVYTYYGDTGRLIMRSSAFSDPTESARALGIMFSGIDQLMNTRYTDLDQNPVSDTDGTPLTVAEKLNQLLQELQPTAEKPGARLPTAPGDKIDGSDIQFIFSRIANTDGTYDDPERLVKDNVSLMHFIDALQENGGTGMDALREVYEVSYLDEMGVQQTAPFSATGPYDSAEMNLFVHQIFTNGKPGRGYDDPRGAVATIMALRDMGYHVKTDQDATGTERSYNSININADDPNAPVQYQRVSDVAFDGTKTLRDFITEGMFSEETLPPQVMMALENMFGPTVGNPLDQELVVFKTTHYFPALDENGSPIPNAPEIVSHSYTFHLKSDPRIVIAQFREQNSDLVINVDFDVDTNNPVESYKVQPNGLVYHSRASNTRDGILAQQSTLGDILSACGASQYHDEIAAKLSNTPGVVFDDGTTMFDVVREVQMMPVTLDDGTIQWREGDEESATYRFQIQGDVMQRQLGRYAGGTLSIVKWWEYGEASRLAPERGGVRSSVPAAIEPGLVLYRDNALLRETEFHSVDTNTGWIRYGVLEDKIEYQLRSVGGYNVQTGENYEQNSFLKDPDRIRIYYYNGVPEYSTVVDDNGHEQIYSRFRVRQLIDAHGDVYSLAEETLEDGVSLSAERRAQQNLTTLLLKNGEVVKRISNPWHTSSTQFVTILSPEDQISNGFVGQAATWLMRRFGVLSDADRMIQAIQESEDVQNAKEIEGAGDNLPPYQVAFFDFTHTVMGAMLVGGIISVAGILPALARGWYAAQTTARSRIRKKGPGAAALRGGFALALFAAGVMTLVPRLIYRAAMRKKSSVISARPDAEGPSQARLTNGFQANTATIQDFVSMGFNNTQAEYIVRARMEKGSFTSYADMCAKLGFLGTDGKELLSLREIFLKFNMTSLHRFKQAYQLWALKRALERASRFDFVYDGADAFGAHDLDALRDAADEGAFFDALWALYGADAYGDKDAARQSFEKTVHAYVFKGKDFRSALADFCGQPSVKGLVKTVDKKFAARVIMRRLYEQMYAMPAAKDGAEWQWNPELTPLGAQLGQRFDALVETLGLNDHPDYKDQVKALRKTFLDNILNCRVLPEGLTLSTDDIVSDLAIYNGADDLRKVAPKDITGQVVSFERLFMMQVVLGRGLGSLTGQGRIEDYLWANFIQKPYGAFIAGGDYMGGAAHKEPPAEISSLLKKIYNVKVVFSETMRRGMAGDDDAYENVRDPQGKVKYFQAYLTEETLNDALRYALGFQNPVLNDTSRILPDAVRRDIADSAASLRKSVDKIMNTDIDGATMTAVTEDLRAGLLSMVHTVEAKVKAKFVVKKRLKFWQVFVPPALMLLFNGEVRRTIYSSGRQQLKSDYQRLLYTYLFYTLISGFMAYLIQIGLHTTLFLAIPNMILPAGLVVGVVAALAVLVVAALIKKWNSSHTWAHMGSAKDLTHHASSSRTVDVVRNVLMVAVAVSAIFLVSGSLVIFSPAFIAGMTIFPWLVFIATWRLGFPAYNYFVAFIATLFDSWKINAYEIRTNNNPRQFTRTLMHLFTDESAGYFDPDHARGAERIAAFNMLLAEQSSADNYYFSLPEGTRITIPPVDSKHHWTDEQKKQLETEIAAVIEMLMQPVEGPDGTTIKPGYTLDQIRLWINTQFRTDRPQEPKSLEDITPLTITTHGFGEQAFFTWGADMWGIAEGEKTHRMGMLAYYRPEMYVNMAKRLILGRLQAEPPAGVQETEAERQAREAHNQEVRDVYDDFMKCTTDPTYVPRVVRDHVFFTDKEKDAMARWMSSHINTSWLNLRSAARSAKASLNFYLDQFGVTNEDARRKFIRSHLRVENRMIAILQQIDGEITRLSGGKTSLRQAWDDLVAADFSQEATDTFRAEIIKGYIAKADPKKFNNHIGYPIAMLEMMVEEEVVWPAFSRGSSESYHGAKWNQLTTALLYNLGPAHLAVDADHRWTVAGSSFLFPAAGHFMTDPRVGSAVPVISHALSRGIGLIGPVVPAAEDAFTHQAQWDKMQIGGVLAYGKFFMRYAAAKWSEGITDSYVAEDAMTVVSFMQFGYRPERAPYVVIEKNWFTQFHATRTPFNKWAKAIEALVGRISMKTWLSPQVDMPFRMNNLFADGFGFYLNQPPVKTYLQWIMVFFLVFNLNVFTGAILLFWVMGVVLGQMISGALWRNYVFDQGMGFLKGTLMFIKEVYIGPFLGKMYLFYVHTMIDYYHTVAKLSASRLGKFIASGKKGANLSREDDWRSKYLLGYVTIQWGARWLLLMLVLAGFSPLNAGLYLLVFFVPVAALIAPFWFNARQHWKGQRTLRDILSHPVQFVKSFTDPENVHYMAEFIRNLKMMGQAFFWGVNDAVLQLEYKLPWAKHEADRFQQATLRMFAIGSTFAPLNDEQKALAKEVELYQQAPGFYREFFGRAPEPLVLWLLELTAAKIGDFVTTPQEILQQWKETCDSFLARAVVTDEQVKKIKMWLARIQELSDRKDLSLDHVAEMSAALDKELAIATVDQSGVGEINGPQTVIDRLIKRCSDEDGNIWLTDGQRKALRALKKELEQLKAGNPSKKDVTSIAEALTTLLNAVELPGFIKVPSAQARLGKIISLVKVSKSLREAAVEKANKKVTIEDISDLFFKAIFVGRQEELKKPFEKLLAKEKAIQSAPANALPLIEEINQSLATKVDQTIENVRVLLEEEIRDRKSEEQKKLKMAYEKLLAVKKVIHADPVSARQWIEEINQLLAKTGFADAIEYLKNLEDLKMQTERMMDSARDAARCAALLGDINKLQEELNRVQDALQRDVSEVSVAAVEELMKQYLTVSPLADLRTECIEAIEAAPPNRKSELQNLLNEIELFNETNLIDMPQLLSLQARFAKFYEYQNVMQLRSYQQALVKREGRVKLYIEKLLPGDRKTPDEVLGHVDGIFKILTDTMKDVDTLTVDNIVALMDHRVAMRKALHRPAALNLRLLRQLARAHILPRSMKKRIVVQTLDEVDWNLTQLGWYPLKVDKKPGAVRRTVDFLFENVLGLTDIFILLGFYGSMFLHFTWDKIYYLFRSPPDLTELDEYPSAPSPVGGTEAIQEAATEPAVPAETTVLAEQGAGATEVSRKAAEEPATTLRAETAHDKTARLTAAGIPVTRTTLRYNAQTLIDRQRAIRALLQDPAHVPSVADLTRNFSHKYPGLARSTTVGFEREKLIQIIYRHLRATMPQLGASDEMQSIARELARQLIQNAHEAQSDETVLARDYSQEEGALAARATNIIRREKAYGAYRGKTVIVRTLKGNLMPVAGHGAGLGIAGMQMVGDDIIFHVTEGFWAGREGRAAPTARDINMLVRHELDQYVYLAEHPGKTYADFRASRSAEKYWRLYDLARDRIRELTPEAVAQAREAQRKAAGAQRVSVHAAPLAAVPAAVSQASAPKKAEAVSPMDRTDDGEQRLAADAQPVSSDVRVVTDSAWQKAKQSLGWRRALVHGWGEKIAVRRSAVTAGALAAAWVVFFTAHAVIPAAAAAVAVAGVAIGYAALRRMSTAQAVLRYNLIQNKDLIDGMSELGVAVVDTKKNRVSIDIAQTLRENGKLDVPVDARTFPLGTVAVNKMGATEHLYAGVLMDGKIVFGFASEVPDLDPATVAAEIRKALVSQNGLGGNPAFTAAMSDAIQYALSRRQDAPKARWRNLMVEQVMIIDHVNPTGKVQVKNGVMYVPESVLARYEGMGRDEILEKIAEVNVTTGKSVLMDASRIPEAQVEQLLTQTGTVSLILSEKSIGMLQNLLRVDQRAGVKQSGKLLYASGRITPAYARENGLSGYYDTALKHLFTFDDQGNAHEQDCSIIEGTLDTLSTELNKNRGTAVAVISLDRFINTDGRMDFTNLPSAMEAIHDHVFDLVNANGELERMIERSLNHRGTEAILRAA